MNNIDIAIIKLLQNNSRITVSEISNSINLSISAVSERLKKLDSSGIIKQYTAIINPSYFKKNLTALMFISLQNPKYTDNFINIVQEADDVLECHYLAGDFDYVLKIITEGTFTLEKLLNKIKTIPGVQKTKTIVALSTLKNKHSISPDEQEL